MGKRKYPTVDNLFYQNTHVDKDGCWLWTGALDNKGYGNIQTLHFAKQFKMVRAHRLSYAFYNGYFDKKLFICHKCHKRSCVNPDHLYAGTQKENIADMYKANRNNSMSGEKHGRSKLTFKEVTEIRDLLKVMKAREIAKLYGVVENTISRIKLGQRWNKQEISL